MRRGLIVVLMVSRALLEDAAPALADRVGKGWQKRARLPVRWKATSPATHLRNQCDLAVTKRRRRGSAGPGLHDLHGPPQPDVRVRWCG